MSRPTLFEVRLSSSANRDLDDIHSYVAETRSIDEADKLIDALLDKAETLASFPERGSVPPELDAIGERGYRQVVHPPYRIIYRRVETAVFIYLIADGRRDMQALLGQRLLWM